MRKKQLGVICIKWWFRKKEEMRVLRGYSIRTENGALGNATGGGIVYRRTKKCYYI